MRACHNSNRLAVAAIAAGSTALAWVGGCARNAKPSAAEIVAKNVDARGGLEAWRKVDTMVWTGHIESAHAPLPSMPFTLEQKRPNKTRLEISTPGQKSVRAFDGVHGWKVRSAHGRPEVQPYTPQELKFAQTAYGIDGPLIDHVAKGNSVTFEGVDDLPGHKAYHLTVRLANGVNEDIWLDTETYLEVRHDRMVDGPAGAPRRVSVNYADYRPVEGLQIPFVIETAGTTPDKMLIEKVVLNAPLNDSTFANPAAPHWQRMQPGLTPRGVAPSAAANVPRGGRGSARR